MAIENESKTEAAEPKPVEEAQEETVKAESKGKPKKIEAKTRKVMKKADLNNSTTQKTDRVNIEMTETLLVKEPGISAVEFKKGDRLSVSIKTYQKIKGSCKEVK